MTDETRKPDEGIPPAEQRSRPDDTAPAAAPADERGESVATVETGRTQEPSPDEVAAAATPSDAGTVSSAGQAPTPDRPRPNPALMRAYRTGRPVEGTVSGVIKGGYEVRVGKSRGFCPHSQIALERENNPAAHEGRSYLFRITQLRRGGQDLVLSRRAVLEDERSDEAKSVRATLVEGAVMQGRIAGVADFGAFVDLGAGVLGLVHISELSHQRVLKVSDVVAVGDSVRVKIAKVDDGSDRISLSMRKAEEDPWAKVEERFRPGTVVPGTVARIAEFGAFVELAPNVEALAPASEFPPAPGGWTDGLAVGAQKDWQVLAVDRQRRRISITPPGDRPPVKLETGSVFTGKVQRIESYGVFVWLGPGQVGLMPKAWAGLEQGEHVERKFQPGADVEVRIVDVTDDGRRIRLAAKGVETQAEAAPSVPRPAARQPRGGDPPRPPEQESSFGTSLADKLRAAFDRRDRS